MKFYKTFFKLPKAKVVSAESIHLSHTINMMRIEGVLTPTSEELSSVFQILPIKGTKRER